MEDDLTILFRLARYCLDWAEKGYTEAGAKGASECTQRLFNVSSKLVAAVQADIKMEDAGMVVVQDISERERIDEVEATIGSMIVNLEKFKDHVIETGKGCQWCGFNLINDIDSLEYLLDKYAPEDEEEEEEEEETAPAS